MSELLKAHNLGKTFFRGRSANVKVFSNIDFSVQDGDKIAIVGKSGAGKSTLLHILGTLEAPTDGHVYFQGQDVFKMRGEKLSQFRNQELGFVFQFHYLMLEFNALENVMMPALIAGHVRAKVKTHARDLLEKVGLGDRLTHKPSHLSGGEQQRVAIARALMMQPRLLLTDEMTGNLDPVTGRKVFDLVHELHTEFKMAMVSVTHDETLAKEYPKVYRMTENGLELD